MPPKQQQTNGKSSAPVKKDTGGGASSKGKAKKKKWSKGKVDDNPNNLVGSVLFGWRGGCVGGAVAVWVARWLCG